MRVCRGCRFDCGGYCSIEHDYDDLEVMSECDNYLPLRIKDAYESGDTYERIALELFKKFKYSENREV